MTAKSLDPDLNVVVITGYPDSKMLERILQISPVTVLKRPAQDRAIKPDSQNPRPLQGLSQGKLRPYGAQESDPGCAHIQRVREIRTPRIKRDLAREPESP
jgi:hypothetical protein